VPHADGETPPFAYEISNGCAVGSTLDEAILYGLLEVIERDAFLMAWYRRLPLRPLALGDVWNDDAQALLDQVLSIPDVSLHVFDATMEHGIPAVWAQLRRLTGEGPAVVCAAGAHLDGSRALVSALHELTASNANLSARFAAGGRQRATELFQDSSLVRRLEDHALLYCLPDAAARLQFLEYSPSTLRLPPVVCQELDVTSALFGMISALASEGLDVIVVDQTCYECERFHVRCAKVVVPGMLPMTFGHVMRRVSGLSRLWSVPPRLALMGPPSASVTPFPHPFP
jgi:ribosomal protein S12 methylthiotransferase accessory factor